MSFPIDRKEDVIRLMNAPILSDAEEQGRQSCRSFSKGAGGKGKRGRCNRHHRLGFLHLFAMRFFFISAISLIYTHRSVLAYCFQPLTNFASSWLSEPYQVLKTLVDVPYQVHPFFGLIFYSALTALVMTSLRVRFMQKRRARMQRWRAESQGYRHGHRNENYPQYVQFEQGIAATGHESQTEEEKAPLIVVDKS